MVCRIFTRFSERERKHAASPNAEHSLPFEGNYFSPQSTPARPADSHDSNWYWCRSCHPEIGWGDLHQCCVLGSRWIKVAFKERNHKWFLYVLVSGHICDLLQTMTVALTSHLFGVPIWQHTVDASYCKQAKKKRGNPQLREQERHSGHGKFKD